jgi:hypothetical protein
LVFSQIGWRGITAIVTSCIFNTPCRPSWESLRDILKLHENYENLHNASLDRPKYP